MAQRISAVAAACSASVRSIVGMGGLLRGAGAVTADPLTGLGAHGVGRGLEPEAAAQLRNPGLEGELGGGGVGEAADLDRVHFGQGAAL
jgi:hypothetical protein